MVPSITDWQAFLRDSHGAAALPLLIAGLGMMLFGYRLWRLCIVCSFALIGAGLGMAFFGTAEQGQSDWMVGLACGAVCGLVSYWPAAHLVGILGGVVGAGALTAYLGSLGLTGPPLWALAGASLIGCTAYALLNRRHVIVFVTAFLGAAMLVSGLATLVMTVPSFYSTFRVMATYTVIVGPFIILVPTVMSCFYQISEMRKINMVV